VDLELDRRVVLVTGGSGGIGASIARAFGAERARVALTYHHHRERAERVAREVERLGGEATVVGYDLADLASVRAAVALVEERWGGVDVLVANAVRSETSPPGPFEARPVEEWREVLRSNLEGTLATVQAVLPSMKARGWGRLVLVAANALVEGLPGWEAYGAAKAGLFGLARTLAWELGPAGILTNVVVLSLTVTDRNRRAIPPAVVERVRATTPSGRLSEPDDVARAVVFLSSAANGNISGAFLPVNGGR
jgi:3-oxoacyl-[acyl-carrier protein] reductase